MIIMLFMLIPPFYNLGCVTEFKFVSECLTDLMLLLLSQVEVILELLEVAATSDVFSNNSGSDKS